MLHQIERGEIPPGSYLLENLQEQIFHNLEVDDFHLVENKARRMIARSRSARKGTLHWG